MLLIFSVTLHDIVHTDKSLTLVFEFLERDLKQYMDDCGAILAMNNVKLFLYQVSHSLNSLDKHLHNWTSVSIYILRNGSLKIPRMICIFVLTIGGQ